MMGNWGYGTGSGFGVFGMFFGWVFMLAFWVLIIWGIIMLIQWVAGQGSQASEKKDSGAMAILEERYAKGEISKEEFAEKKKDLNN